MAEIPPQITEPFLRLAIERGYLNPSDAMRMVSAPSTSSDLDDLDLALRCLREKLLTADQVVELRRACGSSPVRKFADFEIDEPIGRGGTGIVYSARKTDSGLRVALKILPRWLSDDGATVDRFLREAKILGKLNHQNIVKAIDAGVAEGRYFLAMEYLDGGSLRDLVKSSGPLSETTALHIVRSVADALRETSANGIIHRDVKPRNILFTFDGIPKLADLGLARKMTGMREEGPRRAIGTPNYISPEQAAGRNNIDVRSDIYSLGATLFYAVTGRPPFEGKDAHKLIAAHRNQSPPDARSFNPEISEKCSELISWMLEKDPAQRPQTPEEVMTRIGNILLPVRLLAARFEKVLFPLSMIIFVVLICMGIFILAKRSRGIEKPEPLGKVTGKNVDLEKIPASSTHKPVELTREKHAAEPVEPSTRYNAVEDMDNSGSSEKHVPVETDEPVSRSEPPPEPYEPDSTVEPVEREKPPIGKDEDAPAVKSLDAGLAPYYALTDSITPFLENREYEKALQRLDQVLQSGALTEKVREHVLWERSLIDEVSGLFDRLGDSLSASIGDTIEFEFRRGIRAKGRLTSVDSRNSVFQIDNGGFFEIRALSADFIIHRLNLIGKNGEQRRIGAMLLLADGSLDEAEQEIVLAAAEGADVTRLARRLNRAKTTKSRVESEKTAAKKRADEAAARELLSRADAAFSNQSWSEAVELYREFISEHRETETARENREKIQDHFIHSAHALLRNEGVIHASAKQEPEKSGGAPTYWYFFEGKAEKELRDFEFNKSRWRARRGVLEHYGTELWRWPVKLKPEFTRIEEIQMSYRVDYPGHLGISFCGISLVFLFPQDQVFVYRGSLTSYRKKILKLYPSIFENAVSKSRVGPGRSHEIRIIRNRSRFRILIDNTFFEDLLIPDEKKAGSIEIRDSVRCRIEDLAITGTVNPEWIESEKTRREDAIAREVEF